MSHLPPRDVVDDLIAFYFSNTDVCQTTFKATFLTSYNTLWSCPRPNVPFLGVLFIAMANVINWRRDENTKEMELYDKLSNQITEDPRYNFHIETVEAVMLQAMFLLNNVCRS